MYFNNEVTCHGCLRVLFTAKVANLWQALANIQELQRG